MAKEGPGETQEDSGGAEVIEFPVNENGRDGGDKQTTTAAANVVRRIRALADEGALREAATPLCQPVDISGFNLDLASLLRALRTTDALAPLGAEIVRVVNARLAEVPPRRLAEARNYLETDEANDLRYLASKICKLIVALTDGLYDGDNVLSVVLERDGQNSNRKFIEALQEIYRFIAEAKGIAFSIESIRTARTKRFAHKDPRNITLDPTDLIIKELTDGQPQRIAQAAEYHGLSIESGNLVGETLLCLDYYKILLNLAKEIIEDLIGKTDTMEIRTKLTAFSEMLLFSMTHAFATERRCDLLYPYYITPEKSTCLLAQAPPTPLTKARVQIDMLNVALYLQHLLEILKTLLPNPREQK